MDQNKKRLQELYKENPGPMGVFLIRNMVNDKLQPFDDHGYNKRKPGKDEMLRRMAAQRLGNSEDQQ